MSLSKIPLTLAVSWAFKKCITPPNPPPENKDTPIASNVMEMTWYTAKSPFYATTLQYLAGLAEAATILAWNYKSLPVSQVILSSLLFSTGRPQNLRLSPVTAVAGVMFLVGTAIRLLTFQHLGKFFRFQASIQSDHQLVTGGPYSIVRHPSYTALLITHTSWFFWQFGEGSWVRESGLWDTAFGKAFVSLYALVMIVGTLYLTLGRMSNEDKALRDRFGKQWDNWASRVRYQVIPGVW